VTLEGFTFCDMLNGATFFTDILLDVPGIEQTLEASNAHLLVKYIDDVAQSTLDNPQYRDNDLQRETRITEDMIMDPLKRAICWNVAQGNLQGWNISIKPEQDLSEKFAGRVIRTIDAEVALPFLNYDGHLTPKSLRKVNSRYKIAYILMVHENVKNVEALIDALADPTVFIYVHVDFFAQPLFKQEILEMANDRSDIAIMPSQLAVSWAHVSLVWVEIRAMFDLLDLIQFDYLINLSGMDYPLKSAKTIYNHLQQRPNSNWMWLSASERNLFELGLRLNHVYHCQDAPQQGEHQCYFSEGRYGGVREFDGFRDLFPQWYKTSQWMILHRKAVEYFRQSESGKLFIVHAEHACVPDEWFFSTFFAASPFRTMRDPKRLIYWNGGSHPWQWTFQDMSVIQSWAEHFFWIRKVDVTVDPQFKKALDAILREDKMSEELVLYYNEGGIIPVD
jgi:Core-2/I-Branching enzyme